MRIQPGRENYYKYHEVRDSLEEELQVEQPARQIAGKLKIAVSTFHKYKNLLQLENGRQYMTSDERFFREKLEAASASTHATPAPENPKKKPLAPSASQPVDTAGPEIPPEQRIAVDASSEPTPTKTAGRKKK